MSQDSIFRPLLIFILLVLNPICVLLTLKYTSSIKISPWNPDLFIQLPIQLLYLATKYYLCSRQWHPKCISLPDNLDRQYDYILFTVCIPLLKKKKKPQDRDVICVILSLLQNSFAWQRCIYVLDEWRKRLVYILRSMKYLRVPQEAESEMKING